ncbi:hypothetical protein ACHAPT_001265, partial [Fusarium lateritium]
MRHVYGFATVNIVAGHSDGPKDGLFRPRDPALVESIVVRTKWDDQPEMDYLLWDEPAIRDDFEFAPLTYRGWVFQERLLAPRILQFDKLQVYWRCSELFASETWPQGVCSTSGEVLRFGTDLDALDRKATMEMQPFQKRRYLADNATSQEPAIVWERLVSQYSRSELTLAEDKLVALSGVAKLFRQAFGDRYLAGLWWSPLARLLCWSRDTFEDNEARVRPDYRAPSWSWASVDGPIHFYHPMLAMLRTLLLEEYLVEIVDASVVPLGSDETAQVRDGHVTVKARLHPFKVISQQDGLVTFEVDGKTRTGGENTFALDAEIDCELESLQLWIMPTLLAVQGMPKGVFS